MPTQRFRRGLIILLLDLILSTFETFEKHDGMRTAGRRRKADEGGVERFSERVCRGSCMYICIFCTWALPVPCAVLVSMIGQQVPAVVCAWETLHGFAFAYLCMLNVCLCNCRHVALSSIEFLPYRDTGLAFYNHKIF